MADKGAEKPIDAAKQGGNRRLSVDEQVMVKGKISKAPVVKKAKLLPKNENKHKHLAVQRENSNLEQDEKKWGEQKIFILPLMPTDEEEKKFASGDYRCAYCQELCDEANLECKVCFKIAHISCLYRRGYLETEFVPQRTDWACADCSDLTKCLADDEMRKIINVFDQLDFRKNCFVNLEDYLRVKRKIAEEDGGMLTAENEKEEIRRFHLMDLDNTGTITWNEYVDFETASLLSKKNKVELSNHLSKKELVVAKKKFLSYDKEKMKMITKEDAKACYLEYIQKITEKLGKPMEEHIGNCADLFGLKTENKDIEKSTAKTMWPEFVRKLTILLLYDRLNSKTFRPRYWKPGNWFLNMSNEQKEAERKMEEERGVSSTSRRSSNVNVDAKALNFFTGEAPKDEKKEDKNSLIEIKTLMASNLDLNAFKPYEVSDFGSYNYMIRSKNPDAQGLDDQNESFLKFKPNKINLKPLNKSNANDASMGQLSVQFDQMMKKNNGNPKKLAPLDKNNPDKQSLENLFSTGSNLKLGKLKGNSYLQMNGLEENQFDENLATNRTIADFEYSKVTDDIYKTFGKTRQHKYSYPQQIHVMKTSRGKPVPDPIMKAAEEYTINDLLENASYSKSVLNNNGDYFNQPNRSVMLEKTGANPNTQGSQMVPVNKYNAYRDNSRLVPLESSRLDSRSINGGAASNMSSATTFSNNRNNKLMKILGEL